MSAAFKEVMAERGSYHVRASLCQSGMFIYRQGKTEFSEPDMDLSTTELDALRIETRPQIGPLRHLGPNPAAFRDAAALGSSDATIWRQRT